LGYGSLYVLGFLGPRTSSPNPKYLWGISTSIDLLHPGKKKIHHTLYDTNPQEFSCNIFGGARAESVKQAKLLAKRTGLPIFMRGGGGGPEDQLNGLRKEIRRLRVSNANELREIGKLKEMIHLQVRFLFDDLSMR
jgi:hypothetical protein